MVALSTLKSRYYGIARKLGAAKRHVVFLTQPSMDGGPHVERIGDAYAYIVTERGSELDRRVTRDPDELLYWLVSTLTREMASEYELSHRNDQVDSRRLLFDKHIELLEQANPQWAARKRLEYDVVLESHPFRDRVS
jgi:hypothetical protein